MHFSVPGKRRCSSLAALGRAPDMNSTMSSQASATFARAEFVFQNRKDGSVEFLRLGHAHAVHFESDNVEPGARENLDHAARPDIWKFEIVGLDQDERFLDFCPGRISD